MREYWIGWWVIFGFMLASLFSCSPEKRISRITKKHPELLVKDTIRISDTTIVKGSSVDSLFSFSKDTVVVSDSNQIIKYFYNTVTHKHYIKGEVKDRVIVKEIPVPYEKVKVVLKDESWWELILKYMGLIALGILIILVIVEKIRR